MTSIPYDPTLTMGNLVSLQKIKDLMNIAECEKPQVNAESRLRALTLSNYKMKMVALEMENMGIPSVDQAFLNGEIVKLKSSMSKAAIDFAIETIKCQNRLFELLDLQNQKSISVEVESPMDYSLAKVKQFPFSSDSMSFDVQYFRNESGRDTSGAHASTISAHVHAAVKMGVSGDGSLGMDVRNTLESQSTRHNIAGTIVITATCNHRQADIIAPCVLDPKKSVEAWNASFPYDRLYTDPVSMYKAAMPATESDLAKSAKSFFGQNAMYLLNGCTRGSSFVGFVHILQVEGTDTTQVSHALAGEMKVSIERNMALSSMSGGFGVGGNVASSLKNLVSTSKIENHCSLITRGILPNIAANEMATTIATLKPEPQEVMEQLSAISNASSTTVSNNSKGFQEMGKEGKTGQQFMNLNSDFAQKTISSVKNINTKDNKVIDTNSLMNAFTDYINKAEKGNCGVPINFFVKRITKRVVAADYINKYFPNGAANQEDSRAGQLGADPKNNSDNNSNN